MLGFNSLSNPSLPIPIPRRCFIHQINTHHLPIRTIKSQNPRNFVVYASEQRNRNRNGNGINKDSKGSDSNGDWKSNGDDDLKKENQIPGFDLKWIQFLFDPDPDNVLAVGLTGLLTWASVQVLWQVVIVSLAIVIAALKYSFVAALLIFILVALL